jgi:Ca-activated chloride channel family protein
VGELSLAALRERLAKLPSPVRVFGLGVGDGAKLEILAGIARGAFAERISDGHGAARAALRVLEQAELPVWLGTKVDLGPSVERVFPREASALVTGETSWVIGRMGQGKEPERLKISGPAGARELPLTLERFQDSGDLGRRWAEARLLQMLEDGEGRAALVDLGMKNAIITPVTSFYVPTKNEMTSDERAELEARRDQARRDVTAPKKTPSKHAMNEPVPVLATAPAEARAENKEGGTGTRAKGEEGSMGLPMMKKATSGSASHGRFGVAGPKGGAADAPGAALELLPEPEQAAVPAAPSPQPAAAAAASAAAAAPSLDNQDPHVARQSALREAQEFGMLGLLSSGAGVDQDAAKQAPAPEDASSARGNSDEISGSTGSGGLGLAGVGEGGGGKSDGVGLGSIGSIGRDTGQGLGAGHGRLGGSHASNAPKVRMGATTVSGRLPPEVIQRIVRQNFGRFRLCYEEGLRKSPSLEGRVSVRFVIGSDGNVASTANGGSDLPDPAVVSCVQRSMADLSFPQPEGGIVTVVFPMLFSPGDVPPVVAKAPSPQTRINVNVFIGDLPRKLLRCSAAASVPLEERATLWRERLSKVAGSAAAVAATYRSALGSCEAPTYRERARLLTLMLDAMPGITGKVQLYRSMARDLGAGDVLYRGLLARIRTPEEMRELHGALGLKTVDPGILAKLISDTAAPAERAKKLRGLLQQFPDDLLLSLELLNAYEDADDRTALRAHARKLRERPDADARVRTAVGELYLRLAERAAPAEEKALLIAEGRRAFGEIVEFAPEDPVARRRHGDMLLSHGFFAEAARQYETLAGLTPDDAKVLLLRASAAEGQGLLEEALKWAEKGGASGAPDGSSGAAVTARALAATHLAWARIAAAEGKRAEELEALWARAARVLGGGRIDPDKPAGVRVSLTWSHPELHPSLWTNALGTPMPAPDGDVTLGVAQAFVPERPDSYVEVRLEPADLPHAARLGATAELTVVFDELGKAEKIVRKRIKFAKTDSFIKRFTLANKEVAGG